MHQLTCPLSIAKQLSQMCFYGHTDHTDLARAYISVKFVLNCERKVFLFLKVFSFHVLYLEIKYLLFKRRSSHLSSSSWLEMSQGEDMC